MKVVGMPRAVMGHVGLAGSLETVTHITEAFDLNIIEKKFLCCGKEKGVTSKVLKLGKLLHTPKNAEMNT